MPAPFKTPKTASELRPAPYNPRKIVPAKLEVLGRAMREFGDLGGVVVNIRTGNVVSGHQRLKHIQGCLISKSPITDKTGTVAEGYITTKEGRIKYREVDWTLDKEKAANLAANQHGGDFDFAGVRDLLKSIDFDLTLTGFTDSEVFNLTQRDPVTGKTAADAAPEAPAKPQSRLGDLYELGPHRLLCGDSTNLKDVERLMAGKKAALVSTDPPYLVDYTGNDRPRKGGKLTGKDWSDKYREIDIKDAAAFYEGFIKSALAVAVPNAAWYCWHGHPSAHVIRGIWEKYGILLHQQIIWVKPVATFGYSFYHWRHEPCWLGWQHEPCYFGWKQGKKPPHDGDNSHVLTSVWQLDWDGKGRLIGNKHPTQKPVEVFAIPMRKHTRRGDICFEPFSGSGSQLIAAEKTGRVCYGMEISPVFVDVVVERWENFTGRKAKRIR